MFFRKKPQKTPEELLKEKIRAKIEANKCAKEQETPAPAVPAIEVHAEYPDGQDAPENLQRLFNIYKTWAKKQPNRDIYEGRRLFDTIVIRD